ncbi:MAG: VIT family protein [Thermomicrobiales bacterium]|nr:VIT family protein [Thermomicrobiales bacterium]
MSRSLPFGTRHHRGETHIDALGGRLNWLRAGVLGANDGLVSTAGIVVGVAGATSTLSNIVTAGVAGLVAGSLSMAGGEYVSVSTQRDTEEAALNRERWELANLPDEETAELTRIYRERGLSDELSTQVARELMAGDALRAHAEAELQIDPEALTSPWQAAGASFLAFAVGGIIPVAAIVVPFKDWRVVICVAAVVIGLVLTGYSSARLGNAGPKAAIIRNVVVGMITMAITWIVGKLTGGVVG